MPRFPALPLSILLLAISLSGPLAAHQLETLADGLDHPWSLAFMPDGAMLISERAGQLRLRNPEGSLSPPIGGLPDIHVKSQGGLMEVALDPEFATNGWIYLTLAHGGPEANATRLIRARLSDSSNGLQLVDIQVLFTASPMRQNPVHYGGRLAFLPDQTLLLTLGDGFDLREQAQQLDSHTGSIVRLNRDGSIPTDNPFIDQPGARPEIFSYGHRNPQGIIIEPGNGRIWSHEHGPRGGDELNIIRAGANYGWPIATEGIDYSGARISPFTERPGMIDPLLVWTPSIAPAGLARVHGPVWPQWEGDLLVASLAERSLRRIELADDQVLGQHLVDLPINERLRDVRVGPNGEIYLLTDASPGQLLRLLPEPADP